MRIRTQALLAAAGVALVAAGCGSNPAGPSAVGGSSGATIAGTVNGISALLANVSASVTGPADAGAPSGVTVAVTGTNRSASVDTSGKFFLEGVPPGNVELQFTYGGGNRATGQVPNVSQDQLIQVQVTLSGTTATIVEEARSTGKVTLCHNTGTGQYHSIEVSVAAEPAHRAHGDAKVGEPVPADPTKSFDSNCQLVGASVRIEKSTNGHDADEAPGPSLPVGAAVTWQYVVTNTGSVPLTNIAVSDDQGVTVSCPQSTLDPGLSMTCSASGTATPGQYRNVGTVTANWNGSNTVQDSDASHYFGEAEQETDGPKVQLCHRTGAGFYVLIEVGVAAEPAHRAHGDAKVGEAVPGSPGKVFGPGCSVL